MQKSNRDLIVLTKQHSTTGDAFQNELKELNKVLFSVENLHTFSIANEIMDLNTYKIITQSHLIQRIVTQDKIKPFVFLCNKN